jgi:hypothetical protein
LFFLSRFFKEAPPMRWFSRVSCERMAGSGVQARHTMNRATFLTTLAGGAFSLRCTAREETSDEKAIYDLLDAAVDAQFTRDFPRLVTLLHPASTRMFFNIQSARFDHLMKCYPSEDILAVMGLPSHPQELKQSDAEFFVSACERARELQPDFVGNPKYLPLKLHGSIFEGDSMAYVVFSFSGSVHTKRTDFNYVQPSNLTFRKEKEQWLIYSSFLAHQVADVWWRKLSEQEKIREKG